MAILAIFWFGNCLGYFSKNLANFYNLVVTLPAVKEGGKKLER
jgi:hypothetical protein